MRKSAKRLVIKRAPTDENEEHDIEIEIDGDTYGPTVMTTQPSGPPVFIQSLRLNTDGKYTHKHISISLHNCIEISSVSIADT